ncbi:hypothetical protein EF910_21530 [Streptomyces sp. WAC07149]|uniref:hypothetical protein n=1 Tax=Streptomyces sp. WAC07149 TaxID=2487425 RepID=UPI000F76C102|nr:hypothetical protein [Streptomyces sp. WAC07149]RST03161.1 hypothetical protein EF910_21530 [Streptomyces sp. WAC07149]
MRTTMPAAVSATATALTCAALLTVTGCGPAADTAAHSSAASAKPDPLAGRDPAAVLRAAYEETAKAENKNAVVTRTIGDREISAALTFEGEGGCWGKVTVARAGTGEILMEDGRLSFKGDEGFLRDQFRDPTASYPDSGQGWIDAKTSDPSVAHLRTLCAAARPDRAFPAEPTGIRREPDARQNGKPVAVFRSKTPDGAEITDHVLLDAVPYLVKHAQQGPDAGSVEYTGVRGPAGTVSQAPPSLES